MGVVTVSSYSGSIPRARLLCTHWGGRASKEKEAKDPVSTVEDQVDPDTE